MHDILGSSPLVFIGLTVVMFGGAASMMGQALARTWKPGWQILPYGILMAFFCRFLAWSLFHESAFALLPLLIDAAVILGLARLAYLLTRAAKMAAQYPWLYERAGLFGWRERR